MESNYNTRSGQLPSRKLHSHNQLADSTGDFRDIDVISLNIVYKDIFDVNDLVAQTSKLAPSEVYISDRNGSDLISCIDDESILVDLPRKERTFAVLLAYVLINEKAVRGTEESRTDSLVDRLLRTLEFDEYPLMLQLQPNYKFSVYNKEITSKYDFGITRKGRLAMVDEDKHLKNTGPSYGWGEYQIAGELLAGTYYNYALTGRNDIVYAARVIGTKFTFYKTVPSKSYLHSLGRGLPEDETFVICRYPPPIPSGSSGLPESTERADTYERSFPSYDFSNPKERRIIIDILLRIREDLLK